MKFNNIRECYELQRPYSNQDYVKDAQTIFMNRIDYGRYDHSQLIQQNGEKSVLDAQYASQWSAISRKRKTGVFLLVLYCIAVEESLDMTATLAHRILMGIFGSSIALDVLIHVFGETGRTASTKSEDWDKIDYIIDSYKAWGELKLNQARERIKKNKDTAYYLVSGYYRNNPKKGSFKK